MCGVVGYSGTGAAEDRTQFIHLCRESCIRGVHAFGFAYHDGRRIVTHKNTNFNALMCAVPTEFPAKIVFHNRYCTSGNFTDSTNNQPIVVNGDALVFNGVVDMGTKVEMMARYKYELETENDGEIVLRDFQRGEPWAHLTDERTFAGIVLRGDGTMVALRNKNRPLWCVRGSGGTFVASTLDIVRRAGFAPNNCRQVEPYELVDL